MIGNKRVIGVCVTRIQDSVHSRVVSYLHKKVEAEGCKLIAFNSSFDFYYGLDDDICASQIYDFINFEVVDALIILCSCFVDKSVYQRVIKRALKANIPVILEDEVCDGCITIKNEYDKVFKDMIHHVIKEHGVKDTFFMAGFEGNAQSDYRLNLYREALSELNLPFKKEMVGYGQFWEYPTSNIMDRIHKEHERMPGAFICANDTMGVEVCRKLKEFGYRVPDDVIVTGFDDSISAIFAEPSLTSCAVNWERFIDMCLDAINKVFNNEPVDKIYYNYYTIKYRMSCGCTNKDEADYKSIAKEFYRLSRLQGGQELYIYNTILLLLNKMDIDINVIYSIISSIMYKNSYLAMRPSSLAKLLNNGNNKTDDDELIIFEGKEVQNKLPADQRKIGLSDMIPQKEKWINESSMFVMSAIQIGKDICGFFEDKVEDAVVETQRTNRVLSLINILIHMATVDLRQRYFKLNSSKDALINPVSELYNLHGADYWYEKFVKSTKNSSKLVTVSVYKICRYDYIYENYGIKSIRNVVCFVAEALKIANPIDCLVSQIGDDSFAVINYYDNHEAVGSTINNATTVFYNLLGEFNNTNGAEYAVEVNCGCTNSLCGSMHKLEELIKYATIELYKNKTIYGTGVALKSESNTTKEQYESFKTLVSDNLFRYFYQPIVSAVDGEIYAYEALMRTDKIIAMNPFEILSVAGEYNRLYDIEKATLFNVAKQFVEEKDKFIGKKIFVNCIPGYFLNDEDRKQLQELYSDAIKNFVLEITEQETLGDYEVNRLRNLGNDAENQLIALDDFGVGHSNIVNLIRYKPSIVKIDRFLLTDIHLNETKQLVVKGVIEFARMHNIKVLAEGIENKEELCKVIEMGVDYIQGYYTGRPSPEPISQIDKEVKNIILQAKR